MSPKQVPDRNKKKQRLVLSNNFRWWWRQVAGGEGFVFHNIKTAPTLIHLLISGTVLRDTSRATFTVIFSWVRIRKGIEGHPVLSSFFINFDPFPSIAPSVTMQPHLWFTFHYFNTLTNYAVILYGNQFWYICSISWHLSNRWLTKLRGMHEFWDWFCEKGAAAGAASGADFVFIGNILVQICTPRSKSSNIGE